MNENKKVRSIKDLIDQQDSLRRKSISEAITDSPEGNVDQLRKLERRVQSNMTLSVINLFITIGLLVFVLWILF